MKDYILTNNEIKKLQHQVIKRYVLELLEENPKIPKYIIAGHLGIRREKLRSILNRDHEIYPLDRRDYRRLASKIYWSTKANFGNIATAAKLHNITPDFASTLYFEYEKLANEKFPIPKKYTYTRETARNAP